VKLYWFQVAPNPTKVRLYIAEKNAGGAVIELDQVVVKLPKGEQHLPEHKARNPFGSLPVLELDDGTHLIESLAIIDYLEELVLEPPMWGTDPKSRAQSRELERIVDLRVLLPLARYIHATDSPLGLAPNPGVAESAQAALPSGLAYIDDTLSDGRPFLKGDSPTVADCTLAAALQFARYARFALDEAYLHIHRWDADYRARDVAKSILTL
jgi:glutathione S-transferase